MKTETEIRADIAKTTEDYRHVLCSFFAAKRTIERHGKQDVILLFADTLIESKGLYRFKDVAEKFLEMPIVTVSDGRTPWRMRLWSLALTPEQ